MSHPLPSITLPRDRAEAIVRARAAALAGFQRDWGLRRERKAMFWLLGEYQGEERPNYLRRAIRDRLEELEARLWSGNERAIAEHAAIAQLFAERIHVPIERIHEPIGEWRPDYRHEVDIDFGMEMDR